MAIAVNDIVDADDYNEIRDSIIRVLGDNGVNIRWGYGRSISSSAKAAGDVITSADMDALYEDLKTIRQHHLGIAVGAPGFIWSYGNSDALNSPDAAEFIGAEAADIGPSGTSTDATADQGEGFADFKFVADDAKAFQLVGTPGTGSFTIEDLITDSRTTDWNGTISHQVTVRWSSADARRYFFNAFGAIRISASLSGGNTVAGDQTTTYPASPAYEKDEIWQTMLSTMGTITFGSDGTTASGSGTAAGSVGNYQMTSTDQVIFTKSGSGVYAENYYQITAREVDTKSIRFTISFVDADLGDDRNADAYDFKVDENVTGDIASVIKSYTPNVFLGIPAPSVVADSTLEGSTPANSYTLSSDVSQVNEGGQFTITLDTTGITNGSSFAYTITGVSSADISGASLTGNFTVQSNTASVTFTAAADATTDGGDETFSITLDNGQSNAAEVVIKDTSLSAGVSNWPASIPETGWGDLQRFRSGDGGTARATADIRVTNDSANSRVAIRARTFDDTESSPTEYIGYITYNNLILLGPGNPSPTISARYRVTTESTNGTGNSSTPTQTASTYEGIAAGTSTDFTWIAEDATADSATRGLTTASGVFIDVRIQDDVNSYVRTSASQTVNLEAQYSESAVPINSTWGATGPSSATPPTNGIYGFTLWSDGTTAYSRSSEYNTESYTQVPALADIIDWLPAALQGTNVGAGYEANVTVASGSASSLDLVHNFAAASTNTWYSLTDPLQARVKDPSYAASDTITINLKIRKVGAGTNYDVNQNISLSIDNTAILNPSADLSALQNVTIDNVYIYGFTTPDVNRGAGGILFFYPDGDIHADTRNTDGLYGQQVQNTTPVGTWLPSGATASDYEIRITINSVGGDFDDLQTANTSANWTTLDAARGIQFFIPMTKVFSYATVNDLKFEIRLISNPSVISSHTYSFVVYSVEQ